MTRLCNIPILIGGVGLSLAPSNQKHSQLELNLGENGRGESCQTMRIKSKKETAVYSKRQKYIRAQEELFLLSLHIQHHS